MCGIAGIVTATDARDSLERRIGRMTASQIHRGPDGHGEWSGRVGSSYIALGFRRLAILDLSSAASQPMISPSGNEVLIYNGEVYNYRELRDELRKLGHDFRTESDTEVVLYAIRQWGQDAFARFNGMWGLAYLDRNARTLLLSRDRLGVKPLYMWRSGADLLFASEIKAILIGAERKFGVNSRVVGRFIEQSLRDAQSETFFEGIEILPAGHTFQLNLDGAPNEGVRRQFWSAPRHDTFQGDFGERLTAIRSTFIDAVRLRLRSDVPVGVLLSGGLDSSAIAAAMNSIMDGSDAVKIISVVSETGRYDETPFIDRVAHHLRQHVHKVVFDVESKDLLSAIEDLTWFNDEPIGSLATLAYFKLMDRAKDLGVTVILSGQGADELLCGYSKYLGFHLQALVRGRHWLEAGNTLSRFLLRGTVIRQARFSEAKRYLPRAIMRSSNEIKGPRLTDFVPVDVGLGREGLIDRQVRDVTTLSVPALVHYEDRMSMANSREVRLPFLDYRLVELLLPAAPELKLRDGWTKWIFRRAVQDMLPSEIVWRRDKQYFVTPQAEWFKHKLRDVIDNLLHEELLSVRSGFINREAVRARYAAYCAQPPDRGSISLRDVFSPIALEIWMRRFSEYLAV
jgi:asparagine synthase (glutamine-hydrolysing)